MFEIQKILTLSTAHISENTAKRLETDPDDNNLGLVVYPKAGYGFFIYIPYIPNGTKTLPPQDWFKEDFPEELYNCIVLAAELGCDILCFDQDGNEYPFLKSFDW